VALKIEVQAENFQEKGTVYLLIARGKSRLSHQITNIHLGIRYFF